MDSPFTAHAEGFYTLRDGRFVHLTSDRGPMYGVVVRDFWGNLLDDVSRDAFDGLSPRLNGFTPQELWNLSAGGREVRLGAKNQSRENPDMLDRVSTTIGWLLSLGFLKKDFRGYYRNGQCDIDDSLTSGFLLAVACVWSQNLLSEKQSATLPLFMDWLASPDMERWAAFANAYGGIPHIGVSRECPVTNKVFRWAFDGVTFRPTQEMVDGGWQAVEDFPYADGHLPCMVLELDCPTGNLLFANNLYDVFDEGNPFQFDVNTEAGRIEQSNHLWKLGAWHVYACGRRTVCQNGDIIQVGDWLSGSDCEAPENAGKVVGCVDGPLRWFYGCDEGTLPPDWGSRMTYPDTSIVRAKVRPGRYRLTHFAERHRDDGLQCVIKRIGR